MNRPHPPLSRDKGDVTCAVLVWLPVFFFCWRFSGALGLASIASAEIKIKVVDPQDAAVAGAQVQLLKLDKAVLAAVQSTSAEGLVTFREAASSSYRVQVLAPGFAVGNVGSFPNG